jgi:HD-like signal output (HDOD) protein
VTEAPPVVDHQALLASAEALDALPTTVGRLATLVADRDHDIRDIVEVVSLDQAFAAALLRRTNSAATGLRSQVRTVREAAVLLGPSSLLAMALAAGLSGRMNRALPAYGLAEGALWKQSVACSLAADVVRSFARAEVAAEAATAALLHDFGKVVLAGHFGGQVLDMLERAALLDDLDILAAERAVLGVDHSEIGGLVADSWRLPTTIGDAIREHHDTAPGLSPTSAAVSLAHAMTPAVLADLSLVVEDAPVEPSVAVTHADVLAGLCIDPADYPQMLLTARRRYEDLAARYAA